MTKAVMAVFILSGDKVLWSSTTQGAEKEAARIIAAVANSDPKGYEYAIGNASSWQESTLVAAIEMARHPCALTA